MELAIAVVGVLGTLGAALLTQVLASRAEFRRRNEADQTRWLSDRRRVSAEVVAASLQLERRLWDACSLLDPEDRVERLGGYTSVLLTPEEGVPPTLDPTARAILVEAIEEAFDNLTEFEVLVAEVALMGTPDEATSARALYDSLSDVVALLESFSTFDEAADAVERARSARDAFLAASRTALRVEGPVVSPDSRPKQPPNRGE